VRACFSAIRTASIVPLSSLLKVETEHSVGSALIISHTPCLKTRMLRGARIERGRIEGSGGGATVPAPLQYRGYCLWAER
jgi:hypothetical protein